MRKSFVLDLTCVLLLAASALAQRGGVGGLPQQVRKGMERAMQRLENKQFMTTLESLEQSIGPEEVAGFLEGALVRLALYPDGSFAAYSIEGGEVVSFSLGKQKVAIAPGPVKKENLLKQTGKFSAPRRPQDISLTLRGQGQEVTVDCFNKYRKRKVAVTFYVGPLDGLFCMGLAEEHSG